MKKYKLLVSFILIISIFACMSVGAYADYADIPSVSIIASWLEALINQGSSYQHTRYVEEALKGIFSETYWIEANTQDMLSYLGVLEPINSNINYWGTTLDSDLALTNSRLNSINDNIKYAIFGSTTIDTSKSVYNMLSTVNSNISTGNTLLADINLYTSYIPQINTKAGTISDNLVDIVLDVDNTLTAVNGIKTNTDNIKTNTDNIKTNTDNIYSNTSTIDSKLTTVRNSLQYNNNTVASYLYNINSFVNTYLPTINTISSTVNNTDGRVNDIKNSLQYRNNTVASYLYNINNIITAANTSISDINTNVALMKRNTDDYLPVINQIYQTLTGHRYNNNIALSNNSFYSVNDYLSYIATHLNQINLTGDITANVDLSDTNALIEAGNSKLTSINSFQAQLYNASRSSNFENNTNRYPSNGGIYTVADWVRFNYNRLENINNSLSAVDGQTYKTVAEISLETNDKLDRVIELLSEIAPDEEVDNTQKESVINWYNDLNFGNLEFGDLALDLPTFDIGIVIPDLDYDSKDFPFAEIAAYTASYFGGDPNTGGW